MLCSKSCMRSKGWWNFHGLRRDLQTPRMLSLDWTPRTHGLLGCTVFWCFERWLEVKANNTMRGIPPKLQWWCFCCQFQPETTFCNDLTYKSYFLATSNPPRVRSSSVRLFKICKKKWVQQGKNVQSCFSNANSCKGSRGMLFRCLDALDLSNQTTPLWTPWLLETVCSPRFPRPAK